jgi:hypothetical protein
MATSNVSKVLIAQEMHKKIVEIPESDYHLLLLQGYRLKGLIRYLKENDLWLGTIEDHMDDEFDDQVIENLPRKFLGIPKEFAQVANNKPSK